MIAPAIRAEIEAAGDYGVLEPTARLAIFQRIGERLRGIHGFGFRVRATFGDQAILANWAGVLAWWMEAPGAQVPAPNMLRSWQRFVADNLEFRLGVAMGAVVAEAWAAGAPDHLQTPTLETWSATTNLPWFGFWCRELLRWGTLEPFVAFALSQGLARTREESALRRPEFKAWLVESVVEPGRDDLIDPKHFLAWERSLPRLAAADGAATSGPCVLTGTDGRRGRYGVLPITGANGVTWIDAGGFLSCALWTCSRRRARGTLPA
jgi:hypothetical protein